MVLGHSVENEDLSDIEAIDKPIASTRRAKQRVVSLKSCILEVVERLPGSSWLFCLHNA